MPSGNRRCPACPPTVLPTSAHQVADRAAHAAQTDPRRELPMQPVARKESAVSSAERGDPAAPTERLQPRPRRDAYLLGDPGAATAAHSRERADTHATPHPWALTDMGPSGIST